ncbi:MAG: thioredoxin domain-containing protein [Anaerolineales bacterium]|nr:thioredoxin domain-containing protein [Anaerolineales bacterium]
METYADTGLVRFEYKHFAFIGSESTRAAEASECALAQGKFWQYHDTIFANQRGENQGAFRDVVLENFAAALGLDTGEFNRCLDDRDYQNVVQAGVAEAKTREISSTPTIFINGERLTNAPSFSQIQPMIEAAIANSQ